MLIAIISDIHDNLKNLNTFLSWCHNQKIDKIICGGDVCNLDTLEILSTKFSGEIFLVEGNGETFSYKEITNLHNIKYLGLRQIFTVDNLKIGLAHKSKEIENLINMGGPDTDFIFYGHSHKPWLERRGKTIIANPGNIAGIFFAPSFAVLNTDTKNIELKLLQNL